MKKTIRQKITVAMITRNEEKVVGKVIDEIKQYLNPDDEILVVDSSRDNTAGIAKARGARVISQNPPRGYGPAMTEALNSSGGEIIITMDADGTYPAEYIPVLIKAVKDGFDEVNASRLLGKPSTMPWINYLANALCALLASCLYGIWTTDLHSGMRAYRKSMLKKISFEGSKPALPVDLWLKPKKMGYKTMEIFIPYRERVGASKMNPLPGLYWTLFRILKTRFAT